ncbi:MAG TPA: class III extradiol ring-cleavage dioxygenase [Chloroflexota bacterium]|jgi:4,5-DOPA dioxygenase extradiol|nr:class III extradiol ring-cleavage dioxygenase [Chloroflexota bacterium]
MLDLASNAPSQSARLPALYLGHAAPMVLEDPLWPREFAEWGQRLARPKAILVVSAHWESAPLTLGAIRTVPLVYDFYGFPPQYYEITYPAPGAPELAERVARLLSNVMPVAHDPSRGLDHGAFVPLLFMFPEADVPVLQISMPSEDPRVLLEVGRRLAPLRDEGVLIMGSGFLTHSFAAVRESATPRAILEFDQWAAEALARKDLDTLLDYRRTAPALHYAHRTVDHFVPLFIALGASVDAGVEASTVIDGFWMGNSKRSFELG